MEEQLASIGNTNLRDLRLVVASLAIERIALEIGDSDQTAQVANVRTVRVGLVKETFLEELRGAVGDDTIALHLTETQASLARTTLYGLAREHLQGAASTRVDLVVDHVLEALVVRGTDKDERLELATREAVVHGFVTT